MVWCAYKATRPINYLADVMTDFLEKTLEIKAAALLFSLKHFKSVTL